MRCRVVLERVLKNRTNLSTINSQIMELNRKALAGSRGRGWSGDIQALHDPTVNSSGDWVFRVEIVYRTLQDRSTLDAKFPSIVDKLREGGKSNGFTNNSWVIVEPKELTSVREINVDPDIPTEENLEREPNINRIVTNEFDNIFDRQAQIRLALDSLNLAIDTHFQKRSHCLFFGPAGCGKTSIMEGLQTLIGEENIEYLHFFAPSMTRAGISELIMTANSVQPIIFLEELEKVAETELRWLLGVMDNVAPSLRRTNYRVGNQQRETKILVYATCNNIDLLRSLMSGALYSRFMNRIYCPPPSREILAQILAREIKEIPGGRMEWLEPALIFSHDECKNTDPRKIVSDCILGRDRLLTGEYQDDRRKTIDKNQKVE